MRRHRGAGTERSGAAPRASALTTLVLAAVSPLVLSVPLAGAPLVFAALPAFAQERIEARVRATEETGFGRIRFDFTEPVDVTARADNGILVVQFSEPVGLAERIVDELPAYVSVVRGDPDGTGLRAALSQNFSASVLPAGKVVFVDLLPEAWSGLAPGLPSELVAELARLAREAEARFAAERALREAAEPVSLPVRVAELPGLTRLVFDAPAGVPIEAQSADGRIDLFLDSRFALAPERALAALPGVAGVVEDDTGEALYVRITLEDGFVARGFREDGGFVLDIEPAGGGEEGLASGGGAVRSALGLQPYLPGLPRPEDLAPSEEITPSEDMARPEEAARPEDVARRDEPAPITADDRRSPITRAPAVTPSASAEAEPPEVSRAPVVALADDGLRIRFPFAPTVSAAAFERSGVVVVVFQSPETLAEPVLDGEADRWARVVSVVREGPFVAMRLRLAEPRVVRFTPEDEQWALTIGAAPATAPEPIDVRSIIDDDGRAGLELALLDATGVHWTELHEGGERLAIVTAPGPARNSASTRRFAELELVPTAHGAVIAAIADDIVVRTDLDGVRVGRGEGLAIALPGATAAADGVGAGAPLVLDREVWTRARRGSPLATQRALMETIVDAPMNARNDARVDLARSLLAAGLAVEATGALDFAISEDAGLADDPRVALLQGVLAVRRHRLAEAEAHLADDTLQENAEAVLWRAYIDAAGERWRQALTGFRRSEGVLGRYADDLQRDMRMAAVRTGLAMRDFGYADDQLSKLAMLHSDSVPLDEIALLRAVYDKETGQTRTALAEFARLAEIATRPIAARAELERVTLGTAEGALSRVDAISALERLSTIWRGDDIEIRSLGMLGRLYAEEGRWREAFLTAHTANAVFPDHPVTIALHEETARAFDALFLEGRAADLGEVEAVALFFDFKEFLPVGRRGDEIVRRLADRLVGLGLLDKAAELLTHQVENRLEGAGRAAVAARLATIHLMNRRPADALLIIDATRIAELPRSVRRVRHLIEARALSDLSRSDLALEVVADEEGPEIDRLRADIHWTGRRWRDAGEAHEALAGTSWRDDGELDDRQRADVLRAALAFSLAQDRIGLDRLAAKYADKMNASADAQTFALLSDPGALSTAAFRDAARSISDEDTLVHFLAALEARHPDEALPMAPAVEAVGEPVAPSDAGRPADAPAPEASLAGERSVL